MAALTYLTDLPVEVCIERLATATVGRLGVIVDGRPEIFPVNHAYEPDTGSIMFPTNTGTKLHAALGWPWVAFEVDGVETGASGEWGWSVLVVGRPEEVTDPDVIAWAGEHRNALWRAGHGDRWVRIVPDKITGRRIGAGGGQATR